MTTDLRRDVLAAAYAEASDRYAIHFDRCRARLAWERCERCMDLERAEIEAERALEAGR